MNVAFLEVERIFHPDCYIFHDVDLVPLDDRNLYLCHKEVAMHLGVRVDKFYFK